MPPFKKKEEKKRREEDRDREKKKKGCNTLIYFPLAPYPRLVQIEVRTFTTLSVLFRPLSSCLACLSRAFDRTVKL